MSVNIPKAAALWCCSFVACFVTPIQASQNVPVSHPLRKRAPISLRVFLAHFEKGRPIRGRIIRVEYLQCALATAKPDWLKKHPAAALKIEDSAITGSLFMPARRLPEIKREDLPESVRTALPASKSGMRAIPEPRSALNFLSFAAFSDRFRNRFGNVGRNTFVGANYRNVDFSLFKNNKFGESKNVQFRAEIFNLFNHPNLALPEQLISDGADLFGKVRFTPDVAAGSPNAGGGPRSIQLALKFIF